MNAERSIHASFQAGLPANSAVKLGFTSSRVQHNAYYVVKMQKSRTSGARPAENQTCFP